MPNDNNYEHVRDSQVNKPTPLCLQLVRSHLRSTLARREEAIDEELHEERQREAEREEQRAGEQQEAAPQFCRRLRHLSGCR